MKLSRACEITKAVRSQQIMNVVCDYFSLNSEQMRKPGKSCRQVAYARAIFSHIAVRHFGFGPNQVKGCLNLRNHTSILYHLRLIHEIEYWDKSAKEQRKEIEAILGVG